MGGNETGKRFVIAQFMSCRLLFYEKNLMHIKKKEKVSHSLCIRTHLTQLLLGLFTFWRKINAKTSLVTSWMGHTCFWLILLEFLFFTNILVLTLSHWLHWTLSGGTFWKLNIWHFTSDPSRSLCSPVSRTNPNPMSNYVKLLKALQIRTNRLQTVWNTLTLHWDTN